MTGNTRIDHPLRPGSIVRGAPIAMPEAERPRNLVELVHRSVVVHPQKPALRWKGHGGTAWRELSYAGLWDQVRRLSLALAARGIGPGDRAVILSRSRAEWLVADLACLALGAVTCPIYPGETPERMGWIVRAVGARIAFVETHQLLERLRAGLADEPELPVVGFEAIGWPEPVPLVSDLAAERFPETAADLAGWEARWREIGAGDVATIVHTLGEDGLQRGAVLTHGNLVHNVHAACQALDITASDVTLSVLPLSHMLERGPGVYVPLGQGATVVFAERSLERWASNLAEAHPTLMVSVPPFFERMERRIREQATGGRGPFGTARSALFAGIERLGRRSYAAQLRRRRPPFTTTLALWLARRTVLAGVRRATGSRLRFFISGAAPLRRETAILFATLGIPVLEGYGLTEASPLVSVNLPRSPRHGTVGPPVAATELRIDSGTGEILVRGPQVMAGYLDRPELNARTLDADGWLHTGDRGRFDRAGRLRITGRIKNLIVLSTGKKVPPAAIEAALMASPLIRQAVLLGDGHETTGALVLPDRPGCALELLAADVDRLSAGFAAFERPRRTAILPRPLTVQTGELLPDGTPDRARIAAAFPREVAALFNGASRPGTRRPRRQRAAVPPEALAEPGSVA